MATLKIILVVLEALLALNLLIFVHELGHFLAARWRKMKVDRFAIWFGKPIWKARINDVEYALGWIPAGGYVLLPQMATMEMIEGKGESSGEALPPAPPLDKIIVAVAGPLFSFLLAVGFAVVVWVVGRPAYDADNSTTVGWVEPAGPAWVAGLRPGDRILEIDGHGVTQFVSPSADSVKWRIVTSEGTNIAIKYLRDGQEHMALAVPYKRATKWYERKALRQILVDPTYATIVDEVASNSPAAVAGLRRGDELIAINGEKIYSPVALLHVEDSMTNGPIEPVMLSVRRGKTQFDCVLRAEKPVKPADSGPSFGIVVVGSQGITNTLLLHPAPFDQIRDSAGQIFATLSTVLSRKSDVGVQQLGGAVMIIRLYANLFDSENGWRQVLWFSVVLNINLALLNLLPFPVLDGGHIALALLEAIRRRPVNARLLIHLQNACTVILIAFMLFIAFFDTGDWVRSARRNHEEPLVFAPRK